MEIRLETLFVTHLKNCPVAFQMQFRHCYEGLKVANKLTEVEGIVAIGKSKTHFKLLIGRSKIGLRLDERLVVIICFIHNEFLEY
jgi:hypothetical protein